MTRKKQSQAAAPSGAAQDPAASQGAADETTTATGVEASAAAAVDPAKAVDAAKAAKATKLLRVRSRSNHFWRSGIKFTAAGVDVDPATLTKAQLQAILDERELIVEHQG